MTATDDDVIVPQSTNLDEVHMHEVHKLESEPVTPDDDEGDTPKDDEPKGDELKGDEGDDDAKKPEPKEEPKVEPKEEPKPEPIVVPDEPVIDTDITKPGDNKIGIKNSDGEMNYFNNVDEIPDDFEPSSYKEYSRFNVAMADKMQSDKVLAHEREVAIQQKNNQDEIDAVTASWDKDIEVLTKGGILPEDEKERETEIGDTYAYIAKKIGDGVIVDSFAEAHKAMKYDQLQEAQRIVKENKDKITKEKGGKVMGGNGATPGKSTVNKAMPPGVTLDQVHAKYSGLV